MAASSTLLLSIAFGVATALLWWVAVDYLAARLLLRLARRSGVVSVGEEELEDIALYAALVAALIQLLAWRSIVLLPSTP